MLIMSFFFFLALASLIVWTNLLTAVVFQSYNKRAERDALDLYMQAHVGCAVGFMLLSASTKEQGNVNLYHYFFPQQILTTIFFYR